LYKCGYSKESIGLGDNRYIKSFQTLVSSVRDGKARTKGKIIHTKKEREREGERENEKIRLTHQPCSLQIPGLVACDLASVI
jgi:hypothetical protein